MSDGLLNGLFIIPILAVLIIVHEIGHFLSARAVGVKVEEFGIGIPPRVKGWRRNGVIWSINAIPFGGFVRVLGEDGKNMDPGSMNTKSPLQRAFFLAAGSGMNFLLAIVLMICVVGIQGIPAYNIYIAQVEAGAPAAKAGWKAGDRIAEVAGAEVSRQDEIGRIAREFGGRPMSVMIERRGKLIETTVTPRESPPDNQGPTGVGVNEFARSLVDITAVTPGKPADSAGLQAGDRLVQINGRPVSDQYVLTNEIQRFSGFDLPIVVERDGAQHDLNLTVPKLPPTEDILKVVGFSAKVNPIFDQVPAAQVVPRGFTEAWSQMRAMMLGIRDLFTGAAPLDQIAGPVGMGQITSEIIESSVLPLWVTLAQISILLSLNLAVLNLLPLPALDGGRLFFVLIELLRGGRRIAPEREGVVHFAGLVLLLGFMFVIAFLDVGRLLDGRSFIP
ncbi:MAG: RIP metalloprotease RseP [Chloroflexia bacterium]|nr:RIP metalloprotease RseP [Chloroflexia bacterium]